MDHFGVAGAAVDEGLDVDFDAEGINDADRERPLVRADPGDGFGHDVVLMLDGRPVGPGPAGRFVTRESRCPGFLQDRSVPAGPNAERDRCTNRHKATLESESPPGDGTGP